MEADKIGKETRALQVPCGSEKWLQWKKQQIKCPPEATADIINEKYIEEKEGQGTI